MASRNCLLLPRSGFRSQNLAAMASSLAAISRAITKEVAFDGCDRMLLESSSGRIVFQPVQALGVPCTICIAVSAASPLAARSGRSTPL